MVAAAVVGAAVIGAGASAASADAQRSSGNKARDAQNRAAGDSNQLQRDLYNADVQLTEFQRGIGNQALEQLGGLYGFQGGYNPAGTVQFGADGSVVNSGPGERPGGSPTADYSAFYESPDYQFALQQGQLGIDRTQSARGNLFSGGAGKELNRFNSGLASQQFGNYTNRLASLAGIGTQSTNQLSNSLQNTGANISNGLTNMGNAQYSGYMNQGNANANAINGISGAIGSGLGAYGAYAGQSGGGGSNSNIYNPDAFNIRY